MNQINLKASRNANKTIKYNEHDLMLWKAQLKSATLIICTTIIKIYRWRKFSNTDIWSCRHRKYKPRWVIECKECSMTAYLCSAQHSAYWCKQPNWKVALRLSCPLNEPGTFPQSVYRHHFKSRTHFSSSPFQCPNISFQISAVFPDDHLKNFVLLSVLAY